MIAMAKLRILRDERPGGRVDPLHPGDAFEVRRHGAEIALVALEGQIELRRHERLSLRVRGEGAFDGGDREFHRQDAAQVGLREDQGVGQPRALLLEFGAPRPFFRGDSARRLVEGATSPALPPPAGRLIDAWAARRPPNDDVRRAMRRYLERPPRMAWRLDAYLPAR